MIRIFSATVIILLIFNSMVKGIAGNVMFMLGIFFAVTSTKGYCPVYAILEIKTNKNETLTSE